MSKDDVWFLWSDASLSMEQHMISSADCFHRAEDCELQATTTVSDLVGQTFLGETASYMVGFDKSPLEKAPTYGRTDELRADPGIRAESGYLLQGGFFLAGTGSTGRRAFVR